LKRLYSVFLFLSVYWFFILSKLLPFFLGSKKKKGTVLYLAAFYPGNAGYHWRVQKWAEILKQNGYEVEIFVAANEDDYKNVCNENFHRFLMRFLRRRFWQVLKSRHFETVIVRREILIFNDYGNLFMEKMLLKFHPNAILDFDDDLSAAKGQPKSIENSYAKFLLENGDKFNATLKMYNRFIVASNYLKSRIDALNINRNTYKVCIIPTCVDYDKYAVKTYESHKDNFVIGWIGGDYNYNLLDPIFKILDQLIEKYNFSFVLIGGNELKRHSKFPMSYHKWSLQNEVDLLKIIDIGIMPLTEDLESMGKGGFKLIQYMGLGIVSIASPITINNEIIDHGINSFLAKTEEEWLAVLDSILCDKVSLQKMGKLAREKINSQFTFEANKTKYLDFIRTK